MVVSLHRENTSLLGCIQDEHGMPFCGGSPNVWCLDIHPVRLLSPRLTIPNTSTF